jgi:hypothetical protein
LLGTLCIVNTLRENKQGYPAKERNISSFSPPCTKFSYDKQLPATTAATHSACLRACQATVVSAWKAIFRSDQQMVSVD